MVAWIALIVALVALSEARRANHNARAAWWKRRE